MIKFLNFLSTVRHSFIAMFGYEYYVMTAKHAVDIGDSCAEPRSFFEFGYSNNGPEDRQLWGFGRHLLFARLSA